MGVRAAIVRRPSAAAAAAPAAARWDRKGKRATGPPIAASVQAAPLARESCLSGPMRPSFAPAKRRRRRGGKFRPPLPLREAPSLVRSLVVRPFDSFVRAERRGNVRAPRRPLCSPLRARSVYCDRVARQTPCSLAPPHPRILR